MEGIIPDLAAAVLAPGQCTLEGAALGFVFFEGPFVPWVLESSCQFLATWRP